MSEYRKECFHCLENKYCFSFLEYDSPMCKWSRSYNFAEEFEELDLDYVEENYISKDKIREQIKSLDDEGYWEFCNDVDLEKTINILKELLEE